MPKADWNVIQQLRSLYSYQLDSSLHQTTTLGKSCDNFNWSEHWRRIPCMCLHCFVHQLVEKSSYACLRHWWDITNKCLRKKKLFTFVCKIHIHSSSHLVAAVSGSKIFQIEWHPQTTFPAHTGTSTEVNCHAEVLQSAEQVSRLELCLLFK